MSSRLTGERGAATVVAAVGMVALVSVFACGAHLGAAVVARHRAQAAADLAALTAATLLVGGVDAACGQASSVAMRMGARVAECAVADLDVIVHTEVDVSIGRFGMGPARAVARAGPQA